MICSHLIYLCSHLFPPRVPTLSVFESWCSHLFPPFSHVHAHACARDMYAKLGGNGGNRPIKTGIPSVPPSGMR